MSSIKVNVKWNRQTLKDIDVDTSEPVELFKTQLWTLTGVPPDRQTLMVKGKKLKQTDEWNAFNVPNHAMIMMMGSAEVLNDTPVEEMDAAEEVEVEKDDEDAKKLVPKRGLWNLENTCYMNATVQVLNTVRELKPMLEPFKDASADANLSVKLGQSLDDLFIKLNAETGDGSAVVPSSFLRILRQVAPQFAEVNTDGVHKQQDAEECWSLILSQMSLAMKKSEGGMNPVDRQFGIEMEETCTCKEDTKEVITTTRMDRVLRCHIGNKTSHLLEGLQEGLEEDIERNSAVLGRNADWHQVSRIKRLPPYLGIQFVRFRWKNVEQIKAKILRTVSFPFTLDVLELCNTELKEKLKKKRDHMRELLDAKIADTVAPPAASTEGNDTNAAIDGKKPDATMADAETATEAMETEKATADAAESSSSSLLTDAESGVYELIAVLTHQGRVAEGGHYVSWCKDDDGTWYKFDDSQVYPQRPEDIQKLQGGGDWHMAYMCLYRAKTTFE